MSKKKAFRLIFFESVDVYVQLIYFFFFTFNGPFVDESCTCVTVGSECSKREPVPGNVNLYANNVCNQENNNLQCGWDGGDCKTANVTQTVNYTEADYELPGLGSDYYCAVWTCDKNTVRSQETCYDVTYPRRLADVQEEVQEEGRRKLNQNCYTTYERTWHYTECACVEEAKNGMYCDRWYCEEYQLCDFVDDYSFTLSVSDECISDQESWYAIQKQWFQCQQESENGQFCQNWDTVFQTDGTDSDGDLELGSCQCTAWESPSASDSNGYDVDDLVVCASFFCHPLLKF